MNKVALTFKINGVEVSGQAYFVGRAGLDSPTTLIIEYKGKRYLPIHKRLGIISYTSFSLMTGLFKRCYPAESLVGLIPHENPLLAFIPRDTAWSGARIAIPICL